MSPTRRQVDNKKTHRPSTPPFDFDRTDSHHRKQIRPLGGLSPAEQPSPPSRAHAYSAGEGRVVHSTARGGAIERIGGAGADAPTGADGLLL